MVKKKPAKGKPPEPAPLPPPPSNEKPDRFKGRLASSIRPEDVEFLLKPWIAYKMVSYVAGHPGVGKSTFLSTLLAYMTNENGFGLADGGLGRAVILPGAEETFSLSTAHRLRDAHVDMRQVLVLDRERYQLMRDRESIAKAVNAFGAKLLVIDPIDGYLDDGLSEDTQQHIRPFIESLVRLAEDTGAAVVFTRNPGKDRDNLIPGSRAWRDVPRVILQLTKDGSMPPHYTMSVWKYQIGVWPKPRRYKIDTHTPGFRQFILLEEMDASAQELAANAGGPTGRYKLMSACRLVRWYFEHEEKPTRSELGKEALKLGLGEDTVAEALRLCGIKSIPPSERGLPWVLLHVEPDWPKWLETTPLPGGSGDVAQVPPSGS